MMIDRRCFIQGAAFAVSSMAFARELPSSMTERGLAHPTEQTPKIEPVVFTIAGWDTNTRQAATDEVVISINQLWRTSWR